MTNPEQTHNPETEKNYDWTHGRNVVFGSSISSELQQDRAEYGKLEPTPEEVEWWNKTWNEIEQAVDGQKDARRTLAYLQHPIIGARLALWSKIGAEILKANDFPYWNVTRRLSDWDESRKLEQLKQFEFSREWAEKIMQNELPPFEQINQDRELFAGFWYFIQGSIDEMQQKLPYIGSISTEEAERAIRSLFQERIQALLKKREQK